jgi:ParB/RepB/Spo0J family partition protein
MSATVKEKPSQQQPAKILFIGLVPIEKIDVASNIRKTFDPVKLQQLTDSVREHGVNQPILLRPSESAEGRYELISGARRIKASQAAGLKEIPAMVKDYTGDRAGIAQAIENLQREDISPLDEAYGFKALVDANEFTVKQLADQLDKSEEYVYRAIRLLQLPPPAIEALQAGEISAAHGHQLLRLSQQEAEAWLGRAKNMTAAQLKYRLDEDAGTDLEKATFPKNKPYAGENACTLCPRNSGNQGMLFDGAEKGRCMDSTCFDKKTTQASEDQLVALRKAFPSAKFVIKVHGWVSPDYTEFNDFTCRAAATGGPEEATEKSVQQQLKKLTKAAEYALVMSARDGQLYICTPAKKAKPAASSSSEPAKPVDPKDAFIEKRENRAVMVAAGKIATKLKVTRDYWKSEAENAFSDIPEEMLAVILGCPEDQVTDKRLERATEAQYQAIVLLNAKLPYQPGDEDFKRLGVDVAAVKKGARKEAEKEWERGHVLHMSVANSGSETACGKKGTSYKPGTEKGTAVPTWEEVTCQACLKKKPKDA